APIRRLSTSQRPVFLVNSRLGRFTAATSGSIPRRDFTLLWRPFSRSYGAILPSSFSRVLPIALVFSTCPPVSVLVRARPTSLDALLGGMASRTSAFAASASRLRLYWETDFPISRPTRLPQVDHRLGFPSLPRPAIGDSGWDVVQEYQPVVHRLRLAASA